MMAASDAVRTDIRERAGRLEAAADPPPLVERARSRRFIAIGEASHGTHEFYSWRAELTRQLIVAGRCTWIGVEGDWPDCWRIDRWVRGFESAELDARAVLASFQRWPTWMWANAEVADFLDWLHDHNRRVPAEHRVGFYGLDIYSLWDSLARTIGWLAERAPEDVPAALRAWRCFEPFGGDPEQYAWSTRLVPETCEAEVVELLARVRRRAASDGDDAFDALQNAIVAAGAEEYYRAMVRADRLSWNLRDQHMADTVGRLAGHLGRDSVGVLWEHNTHVGDARGTSMSDAGMLNVGQLLRERHGSAQVLLIGFASHRGSVIAAQGWGRSELRMPVPTARAGSHEDILHQTLGCDAVIDFGPDRGSPWLSMTAGHRAIGVVYDPEREAGNYVPTRMGDRYDALIWIEHSEALVPLRGEPQPQEPERETAPTGM